MNHSPALTCSCIIALLHRWQNFEMIWKCGWLFPCNFSQLFPTKNAAPSTRHGDCSTAHQRRLAELPQLFHNERQVVHRGERLVVLGAQLALRGLQVSAPATSTSASLGRGSPRAPKSSHGSVEERGHFFHYLWCRGIFLDPNLWWENKILGFDLFWCYLMLVVDTVAYCNLQLSLCGFAAFLDANLWWQDNTVLDSTNSTNTCLLMCSSLWRDWGPHRLSAKSALWCSGPNFSAVASARHRSLGPWWCLSHGSAVVDHVTNMEDKSISREWPTVRKIVKVWDGSQLATGLQSMAPALRDLQPDVFTREGGGAKFFEIGRRLSPRWSG